MENGRNWCGITVLHKSRTIRNRQKMRVAGFSWNLHERRVHLFLVQQLHSPASRPSSLCLQLSEAGFAGKPPKELAFLLGPENRACFCAFGAPANGVPATCMSPHPELEDRVGHLPGLNEEPPREGCERRVTIADHTHCAPTIPWLTDPPLTFHFQKKNSHSLFPKKKLPRQFYFEKVDFCCLGVATRLTRTDSSVPVLADTDSWPPQPTRQPGQRRVLSRRPATPAGSHRCGLSRGQAAHPSETPEAGSGDGEPSCGKRKRTQRGERPAPQPLGSGSWGCWGGGGLGTLGTGTEFWVTWVVLGPSRQKFSALRG